MMRSITNSIKDVELATIARREKRIVLTRDTSLSDRESIDDCFIVKDDLLDKQLVDIFNFFNLDIFIDEIFSRCLICNKILVRVEKENIQKKCPHLYLKHRIVILHVHVVVEFTGREHILLTVLNVLEVWIWSSSRSFLMEADVGFATDKGRVREKNEDSLCVVKSALNSGKEILLLAVADGMGGHRAGDVASRFVTDEVGKFVSKLKSENSEECLLGLLGEKIADINSDLGHFANQNPEYKGMGTTLTAGIFIEKKMFLMHIGDSRCYMLRNGNLQRLSVDHSWVAQQVLAGEMNEEEAFSHRYRNILTQCLNGGPIEPLFMSESLIQGDAFLFSSDGLHGLITDKDISTLLQMKSSSQEICDLLIHEALNRGGGDNITAIVYMLNGQQPLN